MSDPQTFDVTKVGQYKRQNYKHWTSTYIGLVQMSDWDKHWTQKELSSCPKL